MIEPCFERYFDFLIRLNNEFFVYMMQRLYFIAIFFIAGSFNLKAQITFQRVYGGESYDYGREVIQTPDNGFLIAGSTGSFGLESAEVMLLKTNENGYVEWRKYYGGPYADQAVSMDTSIDGNLILTGVTETTNKSYQVYALKLTMDGDTIWSKSYGGDVWDFGQKVISLTDGGYALFGQTYSYGEGEGDYYLLRLNSDGDTLWTRTYGGPELESGQSIALASDGGFFLAGHTESYGAGNKDVYIIRTNSDGDTLWTKTYGGSEDDFCYAVTATSDGGFVIAGGTFNNTAGEGDFMMVKFDANGLELWESIWDGSADEYWYDVIEDANQDIVAVGYVEESAFGKEDVRIERLSSDGNWSGVGVSHGSPEHDRAFDVKQTSDGCYVMVGHTGGFLNRFDDVYLIKMDCNGLAILPTLSVNEIEVDGTSYKVSIGPNPFLDESPFLYIQNYQTLIKKISNPVKITVYNAVGQAVGSESVYSEKTNLNLEGVDAGVYYYQLQSATSVLATGKMVKLH